MNDVTQATVECFTAVYERTIRRLWILCVLLVLLLVITNTAWIYYESQFEDVVTTETIDADSTDGGGCYWHNWE